MINFKNISKSYDDTKAVVDFSLHVDRNMLMGLIGPDGVGKSTLIRMLVTLLIPDKGTITIDELDVVKDYKSIRKEVGYMPGRFSLYQDLSVNENLSFFATVFNTTIEENYELIKNIYKQLEPFKNRKAGALSGGMKQKLALSCALIHKPKLLVLDEPTTGVDAISRMEFWNGLQELKSQNITILVSTPYMDEAARCDKIALMNNGKLLSVDSPDNIKHHFKRKLFALRSDNLYKLLKDSRKLLPEASINTFGEELHISTDIILSNSIIDELTKSGNNNIKLNKITPETEDVFMELMI